MISDLKKCVGYICPACSAVAVKNISVFDFSKGRPYTVRCECGEPCLQMQMQQDKYRIALHCPICGSVHTFFMKPSAFWKQELFIYECPEAGIEIYFSGREDEIAAAAHEQDMLFREYAEEDETIGLSGVFYEMMELLRTLTDRGELYCSCGSRDIGVAFDNSYLTLVCRECGASKPIQVSAESVEALKGVSAVILGID